MAISADFLVAMDTQRRSSGIINLSVKAGQAHSASLLAKFE
jgi:hypothetical protein